ncbi:MAG: carbon starvation protein A [Phycisphaerales bacterium]
MSLTLLSIIVMVVLAGGYFLYGSFIARQFRLDDNTPTPATTKNDGIDFVPARPFYLLAQHFSAIAAAGPIAGPILACVAFGWLPCVLWILIGVVFIGAVHDFSALVASIRHGAHSIAEIARENLGKRAWLVLIVFIWLALLYVIVAFTQITAGSFVGKAEELAGLNTTFNKGGAVAAASTLYLTLALVMGLVQRFLRPPMWLVTLIFVPATLGCVYLGTQLDSVLNFPAPAWYAIILAYCLVASMLPMWLLQQPRGYLGGFVLYIAIAVGLFGILFGGFTINQPAISDAARASLNPAAAFRLFDSVNPIQMTALVFPFLFVTIACGACSGFHGLICGGTTSKQVAKESHCRPVAFGAMLLEGLVAVIALATVMILTPEQAGGAPPARIYGDGLALFLTKLIGSDAFLFCATFGAMAFSTFVFDTLDVSTRLGRYLLQELFGTKGKLAGFLAAAATAGVPLVMLLSVDPAAYRLFWNLFGTSNQLLAALTLMGITVWLYRNDRRCWYTFAPMLFVLTITLWALAIQIAVGIRDASNSAWRSPKGDLNPTILNAAVAIALLALAIVFVIESLRAVRAHRRPALAIS